MESRNYTVRELCGMIDSGKLCLNQSTQRKFVYASIPAVLRSGGKTTKAGAVINAILDDKIQLPALFFWKNADTGSLNVHDGKQRLLSIYYFIHPTKDIAVSTRRNNVDCTWGGLTADEQNAIWDYEFCVMTKEGTSEEEELSFSAINTNALPLTRYECLTGIFHGIFIDGFEAYLSQQASIRDGINSIGRGEQAYKILLAMLNILDGQDDTKYDKVLNMLQPNRDKSFSAPAWSLDRMLDIFCDIKKSTKITDDMALRVARFIINRHYDANAILDLYRTAVRQTNDIVSWDINTHQTFMTEFVSTGRMLCPQRFFGKDVKDALYAKSPRCAHLNDDGTQCDVTNYSKLEVDHIVAWKNGGMTTIDNAQLLCKAHNSGKGGK